MNKLPKRKKLRLQGYDYSQNGCYFVTLCTYRRQQLFITSVLNDEMCVVSSDNLSNQIIEKWLFELENKFDIIIDQYVIMPDHIHFILIINRDVTLNSDNAVRHAKTARHAGRALQDMMQWFETMTTNEYIRMVKNGALQPFEKHIWQKSYYEHIIRNYDDYLETKKYIANNPIKTQYDG